MIDTVANRGVASEKFPPAFPEQRRGKAGGEITYSSIASGLLEGLIQVPQDIFDVFQPNTQPHEVRGDAG